MTVATTIKQDEAFPASYPPRPTGLSSAASALDAAMIWQRIEAYIAYRYAARAVIWTVEGCGEWRPPLAPTTVSVTEVWSQGGVWEATILDAAPLGGFCLSATGPYRFTASVGGGDMPAAVAEAYRRLAEYFAIARQNANPGVRQEHVDGVMMNLFDATALAKAMQNSGAGDLLRSFRRA
ncbi:MAG TPA: hypothetical protein VIF40_16200 [Methylosinus sp.]|uniref:hypothetical protein n=1 Tax=Methylosinus sp. TaxID=427 RepID=UPI002F91C976